MGSSPTVSLLLFAHIYPSTNPKFRRTKVDPLHEGVSFVHGFYPRGFFRSGGVFISQVYLLFVMGCNSSKEVNEMNIG